MPAFVGRQPVLRAMERQVLTEIQGWLTQCPQFRFFLRTHDRTARMYLTAQQFATLPPPVEQQTQERGFASFCRCRKKGYGFERNETLPNPRNLFFQLLHNCIAVISGTVILS